MSGSRMHEDNFININLLPKKKGIGINHDKEVVDWLNSYGTILDFICVWFSGNIKILTYYPKERKIDVEYDNNIYKVATDTVLNCEFGRTIFKRENLTYDYNLNDIIDVNNTQYTILEQTRNNRNRKAYVVKCLRWQKNLSLSLRLW